MQKATGRLTKRDCGKRLVRIAQWAFLADASLLWWLTYTRRINIYSLLALALVSGLIASIEIPARQSMFIDLVGREDLPDAIALNSSGFNIARVIGPAIDTSYMLRVMGWM